jgi:hypothetical protein
LAAGVGVYLLLIHRGVGVGFALAALLILDVVVMGAAGRRRAAAA